MSSIPVMELHSSTEIKTKITNTTCPYCGVGCGVTATVQDTALGQKVTVEGDIAQPSSYGKLCIKGSKLADTLGLETCVLRPMFARENPRDFTDWNTATDLIA